MAGSNLTASTFNQLWISMPSVLVAVWTVTQNSLHPLSTSYVTARRLLDFMVQGKITEAGVSTIHPIRTISAPTFIIPPFLCRMPLLLQPFQFILGWDRQRMMLACIPTTQWLVSISNSHTPVYRPFFRDYPGKLVPER